MKKIATFLAICIGMMLFVSVGLDVGLPKTADTICNDISAIPSVQAAEVASYQFSAIATDVDVVTYRQLDSQFNLNDVPGTNLSEPALHVDPGLIAGTERPVLPIIILGPGSSPPILKRSPVLT